jgi:hypothetical protein
MALLRSIARRQREKNKSQRRDLRLAKLRHVPMSAMISARR